MSQTGHDCVLWPIWQCCLSGIFIRMASVSVRRFPCCDDHGNVVVKAFFNHVCYINCRLGPVFICPMAKVPG